LQYILGTLV